MNSKELHIHVSQWSNTRLLAIKLPSQAKVHNKHQSAALTARQTDLRSRPDPSKSQSHVPPPNLARSVYRVPSWINPSGAAARLFSPRAPPRGTSRCRESLCTLLCCLLTLSSKMFVQASRQGVCREVFMQALVSLRQEGRG